MKWILSLALVGAIALSGSVLADNKESASESASDSARVSAAAEADKDPCDLPKKPAVANCWNCFQRLLENCDKENPTGERRKACYEAANNFFVWCLGQVNNKSGKMVQDLSVNSLMNSEVEYDVREGMSYETFVPSGTDPQDIAVLVRYSEGDEVLQVELNDGEYFVFETGTPDMFLIVLDPSMDLSKSDGLGIVTVVEKDEKIQYAFALSTEVIDSFDLNNDGLFTRADKVEAMMLYSQGKLDYETTVNVLNASE